MRRFPRPRWSTPAAPCTVLYNRVRVRASHGRRGAMPDADLGFDNYGLFLLGASPSPSTQLASRSPTHLNSHRLQPRNMKYLALIMLASLELLLALNIPPGCGFVCQTGDKARATLECADGSRPGLLSAIPSARRDFLVLRTIARKPRELAHERSLR